MTFTPIDEQSLTQRIKLKETTENLHLDFKREIDTSPPDKNADKKRKPWQVETGLDVAQFANTEGGSLVIGVSEKRVSRVKVASGLHAVDFDRTKHDIDQAISTCVVPPTLAYYIVPATHSGTQCLVVNVQPSAELVCVRNDDAVLYPYRTTNGKRYMHPLEAAKRMNTQARYGRLVLDDAVAGLKGKPQYVTIVSGVLSRSGSKISPAKRNTGTFGEFGDRSFQVTIRDTGTVTRIPYSAIVDAWPQEPRQQGEIESVSIMLRTRLIFYENDQGPAAEFEPL